MSSRPSLRLAGAFLLSAIIGGAVVLGAQALLPGVSGDQARIERTVRTYLLAKPEILREMMERLQQNDAEHAARAQADAQAALPKHSAALTRPFAGAIAGNPQGDVTVVAFMDYACGYCRASLPGLDQLIASDPNVRVVYREYPVLSEASVTAARWALAAAEQGKYRAFHDAMFAADGPDDAAIAAAAAKAGLDMAAARKAAQSEAVTREIESNHALGQQLAVNGTPSWVIGNQLLYGARDFQGLADAVAQARKARTQS
ncbi:DsbA family protein [Sphingomonas sp. RS6]